MVKGRRPRSNRHTLRTTSCLERNSAGRGCAHSSARSPGNRNHSLCEGLRYSDSVPYCPRLDRMAQIAHTVGLGKRRLDLGADYHVMAGAMTQIRNEERTVWAKGGRIVGD